MYGDFEAQRHWMEIALNVPVRDWYFETPANNLSYWGLDYPPLSGYVSWLFGRFLSFVDSDSVALHSSHGFETERTRAAMRSTVLFSDMLIFFPVVVIIVLQTKVEFAPDETSLVAFVALLPALVLMDHGHFQYNSVSIGLCLLAFMFYQHRFDVLAAISFCAAVYFKQLCLYFALALFAHHLARMLEIKNERSIVAAVSYAIRVLIAIVFMTVVVFAPWISEPQAMAAVLSRLFPVERGLYEDKVANFWCSISIVFKAQRHFSHPQLVVICSTLTILASIPFCIAMFFRKSFRNFILSCSGCALSSYLFSFQVHEKQILLPLVPLALLFHRYPRLCMWMSYGASTSLFPLLVREGQLLPYCAVSVLHLSLSLQVWPSARMANSRDSLGLHIERRVAIFDRLLQISTVPILLIGLILHVALLTVKPPRSMPDVLVLLLTGYSCAIFIGVYLAIVLTLWLNR